MLQNTEEYYQIYLNNINKEEYIIPPCLVIQEIAKNRYKDENLDIKYLFTENFPTSINSVEDFKSREVYDSIVDSLFESSEVTLDNLLNSKTLLFNYFIRYIQAMVITIKYPEVTITNSINQSHIIKDLFIRLKFRVNGSLLESFTMARSSYTKEELLTGYLHSHHYIINLSESSLSTFNPTCLGSGVLSSSMVYLKCASLEEFEDVRIMGLFADIDAYVAWESLEGVPYIKMSRISSINRNGNTIRGIDTTYSPRSSHEKELIKKIIKEGEYKKYLKLIPTIKNNYPCYTIEVDMYNFVLYINNLAEKEKLMPYFKSSGLLCTMDKDDFGNVNFYIKSYRSEKLSIIRRLDGIDLFTFKNSPVKLKVLDLDKEGVEDKSKEVISPELIHIIVRKIEKEINKKNGRNKFNESEL